MLFSDFIIHDLKNINHLQPEGWPDIIPEFKFYLNSTFCYPIKLLTDNKIVALGCNIFFQDTCWIAHIIVDKDYRGNGIGKKLMNEIISFANNKGYETCVLIASSMGYPLYKKLGFKHISSYVYLKRDEPLNNLPISKFIIPFNSDFKEQILKLDRLATGEKREDILIPLLKKSHLFVKDNKVEGYYLPEFCEGGIIASTNEAGFALYDLKHRTQTKATIPEENFEAINYLKEKGFKEVEQYGTKMVLGKSLKWIPQYIYNRIGGNFG